MVWKALLILSLDLSYRFKCMTSRLRVKYAFSHQSLLGHSRPRDLRPYSEGHLARLIGVSTGENNQASHANPASSKCSADTSMCCSLQGACFASARCTPDFFAAARHDLPCSCTRPIGLSLLPFQDLYARFAIRLAQSSTGGGIKVRRRGRATALLLRSFELF